MAVARNEMDENDASMGERTVFHLFDRRIG